MTAVAASARNAAAVAAAPNAPASLRRLLQQSKAAQGGERWEQLKSLRMEGELRTSALRGSFESLDDVMTGRHHDRYEMGTLHGENGFDGETAWIIDPAGEAQLVRSRRARAAAYNEAWRRSQSFWSARRAGRMRDLGVRRDAAGRYRIIEATPAQGQAFQIWVNLASGLFDRIVEPLGDELLTTYLSEYRTVQGLQLPFRLRVSNGDPKYDQLYIIEFIDVDVAVDESAFAVPAGAR